MAKGKKQTPSIESLATYAINKIKPGTVLNFSTMVERIGGFANFILKITDTQGNLNKIYLVNASKDSIVRTEQPFRADIMGYFRKYKTVPEENYYILKIQIGKNGKVYRSKSFAMPNAFRQS